MTFSESLSRHRRSPAEATWATHRMKDGHPCFNCGAPFNLQRDYPSYRCTQCGAFYQRTCATCRDIIVPTGPSIYDEPPPLCGDCVADKSRVLREQLVERIPDHIRHPAMCSYRGYEHRRELDRALRDWLSGELLSPNLFVYGPPGTGKSVAAARVAWKLIVGDREIQSFAWLTESDLVRHATETTYGIVGERFHEAVHCHLLVLDEVGTAYQRASERPRGRITDLLKSRLEDLSKRTIFVSNSQPLVGPTFGEAVASRFKGTTHVVYIEGPDLRSSK